MKSAEVFRETPIDPSEQKGESSLFQQVTWLVHKYGYEQPVIQSMVEEGSESIMWEVTTPRLFTPEVEYRDERGTKLYRLVEEFETNPDLAWGIGQDGFSLRVIDIDTEGNVSDEKVWYKIRKDDPIREEGKLSAVLQYMDVALAAQQESSSQP